jgi:3-hydroxyisobutyrate dehydrogenase
MVDESKTMTQSISPAATRLGWIGTGVMGTSMCGHLIKAGYRVTVFNRTAAKAQPLLEAGARWADSPAAVARQSDIVFTMVGFPSDVRQTYLGTGGVLEGSAPRAIIVDMTSSQPSLAMEIAEAAKVCGVVAMDAPVSGGDIGAREARLSIMVGGEEAAFQQLEPLWGLMGKVIQHHGGPGAGQHCKLTNQILVGGLMVSLCEALLYAYRSGADLEKVLTSVSSGAAGSWSLSNLGPRILRGDFAPGFYVEHFVKDLGIALEESQRMGLALPGVETAERLYRILQQQGHGRLGTQSLILGLAKLNQVELPFAAKRGVGG